MNFRQKITIILLLHVVLCSVAFAQVVDIPDPNLRAAIYEALELPPNAMLTEDLMRDLRRLGARKHGIRSLNGIEFATNLINLDIRHNAITDLSPITELTKLQLLLFWRNPIDDISPLANLTRMKTWTRALATKSRISAFYDT